MATFTAAVSDKPYFLQAASGDTAISYSAADFRALIGAIFPRVGVMSPGSFYVSQSSPVGWTVTVAAGYARIQNAYLVRLSNSVTVNLNAINKNPSSTRTHKVFVAVYDKLIDGTEYTAKVVVTEDTNGSGAPDPPNAAGFVRIANIVVNNGMSYIAQVNIDNSFAAHTWVGSSPNASLVNIKSDFYDSSTARNTGPVQAIYHNGQVTLRGSINRTGDAQFTGGGSYLVASVDSVIRPLFTVYGTCGTPSTDAAAYCRMSLNPDGELRAYLPKQHEPTSIFLDGFTYFLD